MSRQCTFTGKKANNGYAVTFSHKRNKKLQQPNLQVGLPAHIPYPTRKSKKYPASFTSSHLSPCQSHTNPGRTDAGTP